MYRKLFLQKYEYDCVSLANTAQERLIHVTWMKDINKRHFSSQRNRTSVLKYDIPAVFRIIQTWRQPINYTTYIFHIKATCFGYLNVAIITLYM
jgi:hypothetical protein